MAEDNGTTQPNTPNEVPDTTQGNKVGDATATFTQADVDRIVGERAKRASESAKRALLEELGIEDANKLKDILSDYRSMREAEMTEAEKAKAEADKIRQEAEALRQQLENVKQQQIQSQRASVLKSKLQASGGQDVDELFIIVEAKYSTDIAELFGDGVDASEAQLKAFIQKVQQEHGRYFASAGAGSPSNAGGQIPSSKAKAIQEAEKKIAQKFSRL